MGPRHHFRLWVKRAARTFGTAASLPASGKRAVRTFRAAASPGSAQGAVRTFGAAASPRLRVKGTARTFGAAASPRHSGFKSAWTAQGRTSLRGKDGLRCVRLSDLRTVCGAGHRAAACPSGAAVGRLCREARCRKGASRHGKAGKYRAAPAYFPKKREIRRRLRRRTMYRRSSFDTAMSYNRKAALASR